MRHLTTLLAACLLACSLQAASFESSGQNDHCGYTFSTEQLPSGELRLTTGALSDPIALELPSLEEFAFNIENSELTFKIASEEKSCYTGVSIRLLSAAEDAEQAIADAEEWFCTCDDHCDCVLVYFENSEGELLINDRPVRRIATVIWDRESEIDQETGQEVYFGPVNKTTFLLSGRQLIRVMTQYEGSEEQRREELEALHDKIASSLSFTS